MANMISRLKSWLARINPESWHYRLVKDNEVRVPQKACTYYWLCVPWAIVKVVALVIVMGLFTVVGYFFGFTMDWRDEKKGRASHELFFDYKTTRKGKRKWATPWEVVVVAFLGWLVYQIVLFTMNNTQIIGQLILAAIPYVFYAAAVVCIAIALLNIFRRLLGRWAGRQPDNLKKFWDRICPPLVVIEKEPKK